MGFNAAPGVEWHGHYLDGSSTTWRPHAICNHGRSELANLLEQTWWSTSQRELGLARWGPQPQVAPIGGLFLAGPMIAAFCCNRLFVVGRS